MQALQLRRLQLVGAVMKRKTVKLRLTPDTIRQLTDTSAVLGGQRAESAGACTNTCSRPCC